jgi:hypothetical protein
MADRDDQQSVDFGVDPNKVPLLFVESYLIGSNENSVTFNFAQPVLDGQQQNIVSRVAMTREQAKQFLKNLNDHIEKFEL